MYLSEELKKEIKNTLDNGGVISYVTDTVWGLGALPSSEKGVKKIYEIKKREAQKPLILMSNKVENLFPYVKALPNKAKELIKKYFPGALTIISEKTELAPDYMTSGFNNVGIRVPDNAVVCEFCENLTGNVHATTSANLSNQPSSKSYEHAKEKMTGLADLIIDDYGEQAKGLESTVVLVTGDRSEE